MDIDEGMVLTIEELGVRFVVTDIVGDYASDCIGRRVYCRIDSVKLVPLRERIEGMHHERANVGIDSLPALMTDIRPLL